jgi:hypothetical protein
MIGYPPCSRQHLRVVCLVPLKDVAGLIVRVDGLPMRLFHGYNDKKYLNDHSSSALCLRSAGLGSTRVFFDWFISVVERFLRAQFCSMRALLSF